jgi:hypothetical protein
LPAASRIRSLASIEAWGERERNGREPGRERGTGERGRWVRQAGEEGVYEGEGQGEREREREGCLGEECAAVHLDEGQVVKERESRLRRGERERERAG